jgi:hypothetical protein
MAAHPTLATRPVVIPPPRRRTRAGASAAGDWPRHTGRGQPNGDPWGPIVGIVKLPTGRKNTFHSAAISSGSEALTSHLGR